jgi:hypothetical protein
MAVNSQTLDVAAAVASDKKALNIYYLHSNYSEYKKQHNDEQGYVRKSLQEKTHEIIANKQICLIR